MGLVPFHTHRAVHLIPSELAIECPASKAYRKAPKPLTRLRL